MVAKSVSREAMDGKSMNRKSMRRKAGGGKAVNRREPVDAATASQAVETAATAKPVETTTAAAVKAAATAVETAATATATAVETAATMASRGRFGRKATRAQRKACCENSDRVFAHDILQARSNDKECRA
jgi:hypothetical protein